MTITDGLEVFGGILTALGILIPTIVVTTYVMMWIGNWSLAIPFLVLAIVGIVAWRKRRDNPSPFLNGLIIGACICMLVCSACDVAVFNIKWG